MRDIRLPGVAVLAFVTGIGKVIGLAHDRAMVRGDLHHQFPQGLAYGNLAFRIHEPRL